MIGYVTLGTNQYADAAKFYDELFGLISAGRVLEGDGFIAWGKSMASPAVSITKPADGNPATVGNGVMIVSAVSSAEQVDEFHARALQLGGTDEGAPGLRGEQFYAGYFRDLDGNKLNAFCMIRD
jgi:catechol 2,3-dioxygenase-like lactoylglutathione lyase family enzyme